MDHEKSERFSGGVGVCWEIVVVVCRVREREGKKRGEKGEEDALVVADGAIVAEGGACGAHDGVLATGTARSLVATEVWGVLVRETETTDLRVGEFDAIVGGCISSGDASAASIALVVDVSAKRSNVAIVLVALLLAGLLLLALALGCEEEDGEEGEEEKEKEEEKEGSDDDARDPVPVVVVVGRGGVFLLDAVKGVDEEDGGIDKLRRAVELLEDITHRLLRLAASVGAVDRTEALSWHFGPLCPCRRLLPREHEEFVLSLPLGGPLAVVKELRGGSRGRR